MKYVFIYILSFYTSGSVSFRGFIFQGAIPQDDLEKFIHEAVVRWLPILLTIYLVLLLILIILASLWKLIYSWHRRRKLNDFKYKLENRKSYIAIHGITGQKLRFFAVDTRHARDILKKTGSKWTIFTEIKDERI